MTVGGSIAEHLHNQRFGSRAEIRARVAEMLDLIGLSTGFAERYPHELSGGQRQRVVIARAISTGPDFVVADEPVSALDVSIRAQLMNLIRGLQQRMNWPCCSFSHDLSIIAHVSQRIAVMYPRRAGRDRGSRDAVPQPAAPLHPCAAVQAVPPAADPKREKQRRRLDPGRRDLRARPACRMAGTGCKGRCPRATDRCPAGSFLDLAELAPGHRVACHHPAPPAGDANLACTQAR